MTNVKDVKTAMFEFRVKQSRERMEFLNLLARDYRIPHDNKIHVGDAWLYDLKMITVFDGSQTQAV